MRRTLNANRVFFGGLYICLLITELFLTSISDWTDVTHTLLRLLTPLAELALASILCEWFVRRCGQLGNRWWLAPAFGVAFIYCVIYLAQCYSLYLSNNFVSALALQNLDSGPVVESGILVAVLAAALVWTCLFAMSLIVRAGSQIHEAIGVAKGKKLRVGAFAAVVAINATLVATPSHGGKLEPSYLHPPVISLIVNTNTAFFRSPDFRPDPGSQMAASCFHYPPSGANSKYPFEKATAYQDPLPFVNSGSFDGKPNVIIFFTEGESARLYGAYGGHYPQLTPNIDHLASRSMKVINYFNHTAPTFRGLIGQMSSSYSLPGGGGGNGWLAGDNKEKLSRISRQTLSRILGARGYQTYFFSPQHSKTFTMMLKSLTFTRVFTRDSIASDLLNGQFNTVAGDLDDQSLFNGLIVFLKKRSISLDGSPFFIATYNLGTHAFLNITKNGVAYGDRKSEALNTLHNYDAAIGSFLRYFYASRYAKNTILIFTSDHAKYPDKPYIAVAGPNLKHYFVDRIPLLIYDPSHILPKKYDADGRDSLSLAPTVLQLLGIRNVKNSFLGHSLFEPRNFKIGFSAVGNHFYLTTRADIYSSSDIPPRMEATFKCERNVVRKFYAIEAENRIFPH